MKDKVGFKLTPRARKRLDKFERDLCKHDTGKQFNRGQAREIRRIVADLLYLDFEVQGHLSYYLLVDGVSRLEKKCRG